MIFHSDIERYDDVDDVRPNASCSDCGVDFSRAENDPGTLCDACSDRRDAWLAAVEIRMTTAALGAVASALGRKAVA